MTTLDIRENLLPIYVCSTVTETMNKFYAFAPFYTALLYVVWKKRFKICYIGFAAKF